VTITGGEQTRHPTPRQFKTLEIVVGSPALMLVSDSFTTLRHGLLTAVRGEERRGADRDIMRRKS